jgi:hypothetical protein
MGNYQIDYETPYVRLKCNENEYEYVISEDLFGNKAASAARLFEYAYERGQSDLRRNLRKLLNT